MKKKIVAIQLIVTLLLTLTPPFLRAASVKLSWEPNPEPDLQEYYVYYGTESRHYGPPVPVGKVTNYTLSGLDDDTVYYIAVSAVDTSGNESGFSNEISKIGSPDTTSHPGGLAVAAVAASGDDGNVAANTLDNDLATRWSALGSGQWIQFDLGAAFDIGQVAIAFYKGDARTADFEILVSQDANDWNSVFKGRSSGTTLQQETFTLSNATGRFLRIMGYGNSANDWNSITEVDIQGAAYNPPDTTAPAIAITSPTASDTYETSLPSISVAGTAADDNALAQVNWSTANGTSGAATGTTNWSTPDIALVEGVNTITVTATDSAGNTAEASVNVTYEAASAPVEGLAVTAVAASGDDGNVAANTLDNDLATRWSALGSGQWIQFDLGAAFDIGQVAIAFYKGDARTADFEILVSQDANNWNSVFKGRSSGTTLQQESFALQNATGRFLRIKGYGNSTNNWNSMTEVEIVGSAH